MDHQALAQKSKVEARAKGLKADRAASLRDHNNESENLEGARCYIVMCSN